MLQSAIDPGAKLRFTGGSGTTSVVAARVDAASKHNAHNTGRAIIVVNHASIDPDLTGKPCNFWHLRHKANTAMRMKALAKHLKKRPDIHFAGQDLRAIGRVKDFVPGLAKVKAAGTESVITRYWAAT